AALREHASASMDISDGLAKDFGRMCRAGRLGGRIRIKDIPLSAAAARALAADSTLVAAIAGGGDDYEILATVPADRASDFVALAAAAGVPVTRVGTMTAETDAILEGADGSPLELPSAGWDHF